MPANTKLCAGFRSASRAVSESGRDGSATAFVTAVELLALSNAFTPETSTSPSTALKQISLFMVFGPVGSRAIVLATAGAIETARCSKTAIRRAHGATLSLESPVEDFLQQGERTIESSAPVLLI